MNAMNKMLSRKNFLGASMLALSAIGAASAAALPLPATDSPLPSNIPNDQLQALDLRHPIPLDVHSSKVEWKGSTFHLVKAHSIQFELDRQTSRLKAVVQAGITTFDDVDYDLSVAVFDHDRALLGVARTQCSVQRLWLGQALTMQSKIELDFGVSLDFARAASFMVSISSRPVMTPDQWQK